MNRKKQLFKALLALLIMPAIATNAGAQARPNLSVARLVYNAAKSQANPQGELKGKLAVIDKAIAEATRMGRTGEVRRLLAQGQTLLVGREWTDDLDFSNSLVLRADAVVLDSMRIPRESGRVFRRKAATIPSEAGHPFRRESGHF